MSPEHSEVEFFNFSAASRRTLQIVPTMSSEVQTLVNRNIFMTTGINAILQKLQNWKNQYIRAIQFFPISFLVAD
ncbi:MAG: hypothetical protein V3T59_02940, partial [Desulfobacterales bacterium]